MDGVRPFNPPKIGDDDHIIRRLGWAVVRQWNSLPNEVKDRLKRQAAAVTDEYMTVQLNEQISVFLEKHTGDADA